MLQCFILHAQFVFRINLFSNMFSLSNESINTLVTWNWLNGTCYCTQMLYMPNPRGIAESCCQERVKIPAFESWFYACYIVANASTDIWNRKFFTVNSHNVCNIFRTLSQTSEIPQRYLSRRQSFIEDIRMHLGHKANFVRSLDPEAPLFMYPGDKSDFVISKTLTKASKQEIFISSETDSSECSSEKDTDLMNRRHDTSLF